MLRLPDALLSQSFQVCLSEHEDAAMQPQALPHAVPEDEAAVQHRDSSLGAPCLGVQERGRGRRVG